LRDQFIVLRKRLWDNFNTLTACGERMDEKFAVKFQRVRRRAMTWENR
jgi:hypothetical protein